MRSFLGDQTWLLTGAFLFSTLLSACSNSSGSSGDDVSLEDDTALGQSEPGSSGSGGGGGAGSNADTLVYGELTETQVEALDACEASTGQRSFEGCPADVICGALEVEQTVSVEAVYEANTQTCEWGVGDNLSEQNGNTRARYTDRVDLKEQIYAAVPEGEVPVFCNVNINVDPLEDDIEYDDFLLLIFGGENATSGEEGGSVLVVANKSMHDSMATLDAPDIEGNWLLYNWSNITNTVNSGEGNNANNKLYCLGQGLEGSLDADDNVISIDSELCSFPTTDSPGDFSITLSEAVAKRLGIRAFTTDNYNLTVVVSGDNENGDCGHNGLKATLNAGYISLPQKAAREVSGLI